MIHRRGSADQCKPLETAQCSKPDERSPVLFSANASTAQAVGSVPIWKQNMLIKKKESEDTAARLESVRLSKLIRGSSLTSIPITGPGEHFLAPRTSQFIHGSTRAPEYVAPLTGASSKCLFSS